MIDSTLYNRNSDGTRFEFPLMKPGEEVVYKLFGIRPDPFNEGRYLMQASKNVPPTDTIVDKDGVPIAIASIKSINVADKTAKLRDIVFMRRNQGLIRLKASNAQDQAIYGYMEVCNYNASNENRSPDAKKLFFRLNEDAEAKGRNEERDLFATALGAVSKMTDDEVSEIALALGGKAKSSVAIKRDLVFDKAEQDPASLLAIIEANSTRIEATARESVDLGVIAHMKDNGTFVWKDSEEEVFKYEKKVGVKAYALFAKHLTDNPELLDVLRMRINAEKTSH